jgi:Protein of unknown function (DUF3306)
MTDREAFLARWSRRKREAVTPRTEPVVEQPAAPAAAERQNSEPPNAAPVPRSEPEPAAELPAIESIDGGTDIRAFLKEGVPQDLARAALRRAFSSDPAIRDFIGLSENAWDFTAPGGVPGFGPFAPDAARQLVAQVLGDSNPASGEEPSVPADAQPDRSASGGDAEHEVVNAQQRGGTQARAAGDVRTPAEPEPRREDTAMQQQAAGPEPPSRPSDEGLSK